VEAQSKTKQKNNQKGKDTYLYVSISTRKERVPRNSYSLVFNSPQPMVLVCLHQKTRFYFWNFENHQWKVALKLKKPRSPIPVQVLWTLSCWGIFLFVLLPGRIWLWKLKIRKEKNGVPNVTPCLYDKLRLE